MEVFESSFVDAILVHTYLKPGTIGVLWQFFSQRFVQVPVTARLLQGFAENLNPDPKWET